MLKKYILVTLALGGCATAPLSPEETMAGVAHRMGVQACYQQGWVRNPSVMASYLNAVQSRLNNRGNPALISQAESEVSTASMAIEDCRQLEMVALQYAQQQAEQARQQQAFNETMNQISQNANQMQSQYQPRTTMCQHYQWGNMTSCSSF